MHPRLGLDSGGVTMGEAAELQGVVYGRSWRTELCPKGSPILQSIGLLKLKFTFFCTSTPKVVAVLHCC